MRIAEAVSSSCSRVLMKFFETMFKLWFLSQTPHSKAASPVPKPQTAASPPLKPTQCLGRGSHPPGSSPHSLYEFILRTPLPRLPFCPRPSAGFVQLELVLPGGVPKAPTTMSTGRGLQPAALHPPQGRGAALRVLLPPPLSGRAPSPLQLWEHPHKGKAGPWLSRTKSTRGGGTFQEESPARAAGRTPEPAGRTYRRAGT